jgi:hypothetical protein
MGEYLGLISESINENIDENIKRFEFKYKSNDDLNRHIEMSSHSEFRNKEFKLKTDYFKNGNTKELIDFLKNNDINVKSVTIKGT